MIEENYQCKHFAIHELVDKDTYNARGNESWELLDNRLLWTIDRLRERYGLMTINDWAWLGDRSWSGLRTSESPWYSPYSQHTFGRAVDILFQDYTAESIRQNILAHPDDGDFKYINSLELGVSWVHLDVRNCKRIKTFTP